MRSLTKTIVGATAILSFAVPVLSQAAGLTSDQINSVVSLLQSYGTDAKTINVVQMVLKNAPGPQASTTPPGQVGKAWCIKLARDLGIGSRGEDVKSLQKMLLEDEDSEFEGTPTGFFGPLTAKAMMKFQERNGIASTTTGTVGPLTRGFFERRCGKGLDNKGYEKWEGSVTASSTKPRMMGSLPPAPATDQ